MIRVTYDAFEQEKVAVEIERMPLYGIERVLGMDDELPAFGLPFVEFKLYDDDGQLMYKGALSDDDEATNQSAALRWGETMAGCTTIKVRREGGYVQEIA